MANPNIPFGFKPTPLVRARPYGRDAASSTAIFKMDVVQLDDDGKINAAAAGNTVLIGSAIGFLTGSAAGTTPVADHPMQEFLAQDDGVGTTFEASHIGTNCDHIATAGEIKLLLGRHEIDISTTVATTAGFQLLQFISSAEQSVGANSILRVVCNEHVLRTGTGI
mgnify:CR=1 FL=1